MKLGQGHAKGSAAEVEVAGLCDKWYNLPKKTFWRTHASGAMPDEPGDIYSRQTHLTGPLPWMIEVKHIRSYDLLMDVVNHRFPHPQLYGWLAEMTWQQQDYIKRYEKVPGIPPRRCIRLLVFKRNFGPGFWVGFYRDELLPPRIANGASGTYGWDQYLLVRQYITIPIPAIDVEVPGQLNDKKSPKRRVNLDAGSFVVTEWKTFIQIFTDPKNQIL